MHKELTDASLSDNRLNRVTDLASIIKKSEDQSKVYVCNECGKDLVLDTTYKIRNPYGGIGYVCLAFGCKLRGTVIDSSLTKLNVKPKEVKGLIQDRNNNNKDFGITIIPDNRGYENRVDEYAKHDPEGDNDRRMELEGFHIIESRIELTDSFGRNRTLVTRSK